MHIPGYSQLTRVYKNLSPLEYGVFLVLAVALVIGVFGLAGNLQSQVSTTTPIQGGSFTEGVVGFPRYINPVLARTDADQDLSALIYAGLTKLDENGKVEMDLADSLEVSDDGETYTFTIDPEASFHDGHPVEAEDVVYTVSVIRDQLINSPHQVDWSGVNVQATGPRTVEFNLSSPFQDFPYVTRIGILPEHLWRQESAQTFPFSSLNTNPIGAGPYEVERIDRNNEGIPNYFRLTASDNYPDTPYIETINLRFFANETERQQAFADGSIDAMAEINPSQAEELTTAEKTLVVKPLNRIFAVFFNQNQNEALANAEVRQALAQVIPKEEILQEALFGYGNIIDGPLPSEVITSDSTTGVSASSSEISIARESLTEAGWEVVDGQLVQDGQVLAIELTTADIPSLQKTVEIIAEKWEELGVRVQITSLPTSDLSRNVIRPRQYEALLFGQSINPSRDLYPFWHSSGQDDPGLNLAMYTNSEIDEALTTWRSSASSSERNQLQETIVETIKIEQPAIFLYTPAFIYVVPETLQNIITPPITKAGDRFAQIEDWYINTHQIWNIFNPLGND